VDARVSAAGGSSHSSIEKRSGRIGSATLLGKFVNQTLGGLLTWA